MEEVGEIHVQIPAEYADDIPQFVSELESSPSVKDINVHAATLENVFLELARNVDQKGSKHFFFLPAFILFFQSYVKTEQKVMGKPTQAALDLSSIPTPYLSRWVLEALPSLLGWVEYNLGKKIFFLCQKFLPTPRNAPMGSKGSFTGSKMVKNFWWKLS